MAMVIINNDQIITIEVIVAVVDEEILAEINSVDHEEILTTMLIIKIDSPIAWCCCYLFIVWNMTMAAAALLWFTLARGSDTSQPWS